MKTIITVLMFLVSSSIMAGGPYYGPYGFPMTQTYNYNQGFHTDWYNSPLGMGAAQAGVGLIYGVVNAMSKPEQVIIQQPGYNSGYSNNPNQGYPQQMCIDKTIYDAQGNPRIAKVCE